MKYIRLIFLVVLLCPCAPIAIGASSGDETVTYIGFGAQQTVSGSLHALDVDGQIYVVDVGAFMGREGPNYPWPEALDPSTIAAVFITHAHADHIGRLPLLLHKGYSGPIFMTQPTYDIARISLPAGITLTDFGAERFYYSRNNRNRERIPVYLEGYHFGPCTVAPSNRVFFHSKRSKLNDRGFYLARAQRQQLEDEILGRLEEQTHVLHPNKPVRVGPLTLEFIHTSHMPGSVMVAIQVAEMQLLFSGDLGSDSSPILAPNQRLTGAIDHLWVEGTYAQPRNVNYDEQRREFRYALGQLVADGYRIVVPAFVVDRTQQVLSEIALGIEEGVIPARTSVRVYSGTANRLTRLYQSWQRDSETRSRYFSDDFHGAAFTVPHYFEPDIDWGSTDPLGLSHGEIGIMSSGMIEHAFSRQALMDYGGDPKTAFYLVGYQAPDTPGGQLRSGRRDISLGEDTLTVQAKVRVTSGFSGHAAPNQIAEMFHDLDIANLYLVHLDRRNIESLTEFYRETLGVTPIAPKSGERISLSQ